MNSVHNNDSTPDTIRSKPMIIRRSIFPAHPGQAMTLVEVMIALGIAGFLLLVANQMLQDINKWMASISIDAELVEIAQAISSRVSCEETYQRLGISAGLNPDPTTQVQLYDKSGREIFQSHYMTGIFAAYKKIQDDWLVSSTWTGQGFIIQVGKASKKPSVWAKDPVTKQSLDLFAPGHTIFGSPPNIPLCPKQSRSNVLLTRVATTSGTINSLLAKPNPGGIFDVLGRNGPSHPPMNCCDLIVMNLTPMTFVRGCHYFCRMPPNNYTSGIMVGLDDAVQIKNSAGEWIANVGRPVGESIVTCECYL
jgi:prepilin-type N-terminal cleavage/methylation domain-containing protein